MCGIAGIIDFRSAICAATLTRMRDALVHRGPDDAGLWFSEDSSPAVGLAHRRLAIIDRSAAGHQPMLSPDGQTVIVFNGEIYNYRELAAELTAAGHRFRSASDTEVVLAAYQAWGVDCLNRFNGMWALAIWDNRRRRLFAARDRLGKKPFYYHHNGRHFAFASEMKALVCHPDIGCQPREAAVDRFCRSFSFEQQSGTMLAGIEQLPPAHRLILDADGRLQIERYWKLDPTQKLHLASTGEYVERFQELFEDAVRIRLRADVPVGSSLSGGLDSSLIVGTIAKLRQTGTASNCQRTFSARFPHEPVFDEGPFIDAVVAHTGVEAHRTMPTVEGLLDEMRALHYHQEEPCLSSSIYAQWEVMRLARQRATVVLLDGQGSDELLAGYIPYLAPHLMDLAQTGRWRCAWQEYRRFAGRQAEMRRSYPQANMRVFELSLRVLLSKGVARVGRRIAGSQTVAASEAEPPGQRPANRLWRQLHADLTRRSIPLLLRYADRNSMAFSVEVRNPFLDYRLVEFLMQVPGDLKIRDGWTKFLLRESGRGTLPECVRNRVDKVGFITPEDEWLRGPLRSWAEGILFGRRLRSLPHYPAKRVAWQWHQHQSRQRNLRAQLWPWLSLHEWLAMLEEGALSQARSLRRAA